MIRLDVTQTGLHLQLTAADRLAAFTRGLHVPFERIVGTRVMSREDAVASSPRPACPGSWWPGRLRAGSWGVGERRQLWAARRGAHVVVVFLRGRPFHRVVVEVEDPQHTHRCVEDALLHSKIISGRRGLRSGSRELPNDGG